MDSRQSQRPFAFHRYRAGCMPAVVPAGCQNPGSPAAATALLGRRSHWAGHQRPTHTPDHSGGDRFTYRHGGRGGRACGIDIPGCTRDGQASDRAPRCAHYQFRPCRCAAHDGGRLGGPHRLCTGGDSGGRDYRHRRRTLFAMDTATRTTDARNMTDDTRKGETDRCPTLGTRELALGYGERKVINGLTVEIPPGKVTAIVGPNGCGKSTLLAGLARILAPRSGAVLLDGRDINTLATREVAHKLALLPQDASAPDGLTVEELIQFGRQPYRSLMRQWSPKDAEIVQAALHATQLQALADRPLDALSGGQRQRAWIAMTVAQDTPLLLLDEPTSALDLGHQIEVLELVRELSRK